MKADSNENHKLGFVLSSLNLKQAEPVYVAFSAASDVNKDILWEIFGGNI